MGQDHAVDVATLTGQVGVGQLLFGGQANTAKADVWELIDQAPTEPTPPDPEATVEADPEESASPTPA